jgi:LysM repeat protein
MPIRYNSFVDDPDNATMDIITARGFTDLIGLTDERPSGYNVPEWKKPQQEVIVKPTVTITTTKKPKPDKKRDKVTPIQNNLQPEGLVQSNMELNADVSGLRPQARVPKYYDVEDIVNNGRSQTNYQWYPENAEDLRQLSEESGDKRIMVPRYQTGGSLPGSVGFTYARTKGIPSEGPYAKKTMPSAQNGEEMRYYQNGLDWKPKTISRNGGWLDGYEKAQTGYTTGDKVEYGTPEYTEAYNRGEVITDKGVRSPIALDEVVIQNSYKRPRGVWEQYADKIAEENKDAGLLGAIIGTPISAITSLPQLMGMKALTGEMQRPSEAMDIENPYGAFAVDAVTDPANLIGVGELTALGRVAKAESLAALGKGVNVAGQISKQGLREGVDLIHPVGRTLAQIEREGIANGLSPQEIKKLQLEKVGITSAQREGYFPGVSEIVTEYITPYSYDNAGARIKNIPRRIIKGEKNSKNLVDVDNDFVFDFEAKNLVSKPRYDAFRMYSGMPQKNNTFRMAETVPIDHPSYSAEQLNNLEKFSLNQEKDLLSTLPSEFDLAYLKYGEPQDLVESLPMLKTELQKIQDIKNKGIDIGNDFRQTNVMGGYNRRYFDNKMEYNDIWDLDLKGTKVEKYFGKPFLSHGQLDYSFLPAEKELTKLIEKAEYYSKNINKIKKPETEYLDTKDFINHINQLKIQDITINKKQKDGGIIKDDRGQWNHPGEITEINSPYITMQGVPYPVLGVSNTGDVQMMYPEQEYEFDGDSVVEYPMARNGINNLDARPLVKLDQLTNFTNYNTKQPGAWLDKYQKGGDILDTSSSYVRSLRSAEMQSGPQEEPIQDYDRIAALPATNTGVAKNIPIPVDGGYVVKKGDTLSKIAKESGVPLNTLAKVNKIKNVDQISVNQKLLLPAVAQTKPLPEKYQDWNVIKKKTNLLNKLSDLSKIVSYHKSTPNEIYSVVDKKNSKLLIYQGDKLLKSFEVGTGQNPGDAQTVTKVVNGKTNWDSGNKSTGAGIYTVSNVDPSSDAYYGLPSFNLKNEQGIEVATSIHGTPKGRRKYFNNNTLTDNRMSNGCVNGKCQDLPEMYNYLTEGTKIYILPEDKGNSFEIVDGKPVFRVDPKNSKKYESYIDSKGKTQKGQGVNRTTNTLVYKPIKPVFNEEKFKDDVFTTFDFNDEKEYNKTTKPFVKSLTDNKKAIMKAAQIPSDVYNELAKMAFGIYGTESNYGDTHSAVGNFSRAVGKFISPSNSSSPDYEAKATTYGADEDTRSVGLTQIRWSYLNKKEKEVLKKLGITSNKDFLDPKKAAIGTTAVLGVRYNEQLTSDQKKDIWKNLPTKWNRRENYPSRVKANSSYLNFEQLD